MYVSIESDFEHRFYISIPGKECQVRIASRARAGPPPLTQLQ
jgi:hypothetical protein